MPLAAHVAHARLQLERWNFLARFPANKWLILVDLRARILMAEVSTVVDGWRGRIIGLKLPWPTKIPPFFRPDGEAKMLKTAGVLLYRRLATFLWWFGSFTRPEMGDRMRERESPATPRPGSIPWDKHMTTGRMNQVAFLSDTTTRMIPDANEMRGRDGQGNRSYRARAVRTGRS